MPRNTILYAEDEEGIRNVFERVIKREFPDYGVQAFSDGTSLDERLGGDASDVKLVFTDHNMPGIDGGEIIEKYAKRPEFEDVIFILCSGGYGGIEEKARENGAYDFIGKPFDSSELVGVLKRALNQ